MLFLVTVLIYRSSLIGATSCSICLLLVNYVVTLLINVSSDIFDLTGLSSGRYFHATASLDRLFYFILLKLG
jgi:hypothetical protein